MVIAIVPWLVCLIGLVLYLGAEGKLGTIGLHAFWTGLLVALYTLAHAVVHIG